jgi:hypothetical protein
LRRVSPFILSSSREMRPPRSKRAPRSYDDGASGGQVPQEEEVGAKDAGEAGRRWARGRLSFSCSWVTGMRGLESIGFTMVWSAPLGTAAYGPVHEGGMPPRSRPRQNEPVVSNRETLKRGDISGTLGTGERASRLLRVDRIVPRPPSRIPPRRNPPKTGVFWT